MQTSIPHTLDYTIRPMNEADIPTWVNFYQELEALEPSGEAVTLAEFTERFQKQGNSTRRFLATLRNPDASEGRMIGLAAAYVQDDGSEAVVRINVHPDYRKHGVGSALYQRLEQLVAARVTGRWVVVPNMKAVAAIEFWQHRGFYEDGAGWDMRLPAEAQVPAQQLPEGFTIRTFVPGQDEELLLRVVNDSFAEHYWYREQTLAEMVEQTQQPQFRPAGVFFAFDGAQIAGFCIAYIDSEAGREYGWINGLGVMPAYRGRKLGKALLLIGIQYLRQLNPVVELGVESSNTPAVTLYEAMGFFAYRGMVRLVKKLG